MIVEISSSLSKIKFKVYLTSIILYVGQYRPCTHCPFYTRLVGISEWKINVVCVWKFNISHKIWSLGTFVHSSFSYTMVLTDKTCTLAYCNVAVTFLNLDLYCLPFDIHHPLQKPVFLIFICHAHNFFLAHVLGMLLSMNTKAPNHPRTIPPNIWPLFRI